jgi:ATP-dependent RNA helicase RhlE
MTFNELGLNARMVSRLDALGLTNRPRSRNRRSRRRCKAATFSGIAQTGTGKTAAFGIPLVVALSKTPGTAAPRSARGWFSHRPGNSRARSSRAFRG